MSKNYISRKKNTFLKIIPIALIIGLLPLIVSATIMNFDTTELFWFTTNNYSMADIFSYYKSQLLIYAALMMLLLLLYKTFVRKTPFDYKLYSPALSYTIIVVLSTLFSISIYYSTKGYVNHLENVFVLCAYIVVFIYTATTIDSSKDIKLLIWIWITSICILTIIGFTQYIGHDIYQSTFGTNLIIPKSIRPLFKGVEFTLGDDSIIYQSLFHYNYVSFYSAMAFPFFFALIIGDKKLSHRIIFSVIALLILFNLVGSQGRNGFIGVAVGSVIVILMNGRKALFSRKIIIVASAILIFSGIALLITDSAIERRFKDELTTTSTIDYSLNSIITENSNIYIDHDDFIISVTGSYNEEGLPSYSFHDQDSNSYRAFTDGSTIELASQDGNAVYKTLKITMMTYKDENVLSFNIDGYDWHFIFNDNLFYYLNENGRAVTLTEIDSIGFDGRERIGSARGYIWSRSLPLILKKPILGYGPDTFTLAFPQHDYVGKLNAYETYMPIVDKPHNIFMNYAISTGLVSLLAILAIISIAIWKSFSAQKVQGTTPDIRMLKTYSIASTGSIFGYLSAGFFNDTNLHVTAVFWVIVGISYASNRLLISQKNG